MHDLEQAMRGAMRAWGDLERDVEEHAGSMLACMTRAAPWIKRVFIAGRCRGLVLIAVSSLKEKRVEKVRLIACRHSSARSTRSAASLGWYRPREAGSHPRKCRACTGRRAAVLRQRPELRLRSSS